MSFLDDLKKNVTDLTENVAKKSSSMIEAQKLKLKKASLESDLRDYYVVLGRLFERRLEGANVDADGKNVVDKIHEIRGSIFDIEEELRKMKGVIRCAGCGANVSEEHDFCPKCGAKLQKKTSEEGAKGQAPDVEAQTEDAQANKVLNEDVQTEDLQNENTENKNA